MRRLVCFLTLPLLIAPAFADEAPKVERSAPPHVRQNSEQHFAQANVAHDGHLTLDEAKGGYPVVAKHFADIDVDHKGYVTENDIRAWRVMRKAAHRLTLPPEDKKLTPRPAKWAYPIHRPDRGASDGGSSVATAVTR